MALSSLGGMACNGGATISPVGADGHDSAGWTEVADWGRG